MKDAGLNLNLEGALVFTSRTALLRGNPTKMTYSSADLGSAVLSAMDFGPVGAAEDMNKALRYAHRAFDSHRRLDLP